MLNSTEINGLILCGGQSSRMGFDKSKILVNNRPIYDVLAEQLEAVKCRPFLSCRKNQSHLLASKWNPIIDSGKIKGPAAGLHPAMKNFEKAAWILLACDMPFVDAELLLTLIENRNSSRVASAFSLQSEWGPFFQPFPAIYEPSFFSLMEKEIPIHHPSLKRLLEERKAHSVNCPAPQKLININRKEDVEKFPELSASFSES